MERLRNQYVIQPILPKLKWDINGVEVYRAEIGGGLLHRGDLADDVDEALS